MLRCLLSEFSVKTCRCLKNLQEFYIFATDVVQSNDLVVKKLNIKSVGEGNET